MPAKFFKCSDGETIEIEQCLQPKGCRLKNRCATLPYLRLIGFDRKWEGVSPSAVGNGARMLYLKAITDYIIDPEQRVWAAFGTSTHEKLSIHSYNVLSEEKLSDDRMKGIADLLEEDEEKPGYYLLYDYKIWGSYKVARALGITTETVEETILDEKGKPVILKSGPNKGQPKTRKKRIITQDQSNIDLKAEEYQLNRYRIFFERTGFPISKIQIQILVRDGGLYTAKNRGIEKNKYLIPIKRLITDEVLRSYQELSAKVNQAFKTGYTKHCNNWESWDRRRCEKFCEVSEACQKMSKDNNEKWGLI